MCAVTCCVNAAQPCLHKVLVGLSGVGDRHELCEWIALLVWVAVNEIAHVDQGIGIPHCKYGYTGLEKARNETYGIPCP